MSMTVVVTRDVEARYRGFLSSAMLEVSPGVYVANRLSAKCREQVWDVVSEWYSHLGQGSISMLWPDTGAEAGLQVRILGSPPRVPVLIDGALLMHRPGS